MQSLTELGIKLGGEIRLCLTINQAWAQPEPVQGQGSEAGLPGSEAMGASYLLLPGDIPFSASCRVPVSGLQFRNGTEHKVLQE